LVLGLDADSVDTLQEFEIETLTLVTNDVVSTHRLQSLGVGASVAILVIEAFWVDFGRHCFAGLRVLDLHGCIMGLAFHQANFPVLQEAHISLRHGPIDTPTRVTCIRFVQINQLLQLSSLRVLQVRGLDNSDCDLHQTADRPWAGLYVRSLRESEQRGLRLEMSRFSPADAQAFDAATDFRNVVWT